MPVKVSFMRPGTMGSVNAVAIGTCRVCETITVPGTTTATALPGEIAYLVNTEAAAVVVANGTAPDAAATAATAATSEGFGVSVGNDVALVLNGGDKVNIKAFV